MADIAESSSTPCSKNDDKPVIVRVKRKATHSPLEAFWLEINERPLKRPLVNFGNLSISDSREKEYVKAKKVLVQHVETITSPEATVDVLQSFVPNFEENAFAHRAKNEEHRRSIKTEKKQDQLLVKAKQKQELLSKNARFQQIWRSRKGKGGASHDGALHEMCHLYDVVRVDVEETTNQLKAQEDEDLEDHRIMASYLPLLREFIPSAAEEIESDIHSYMSKQASTDHYVYDLYAVKEDVNMTVEDSLNPFPLVQVEDDSFYDGPDESEYESDDSNAEDNPANDYPEEEISEDYDEVESGTSNDESEEGDDASSKSSKDEDMVNRDRSGDADPLYEDDIYGDDGDCGAHGDYDDDDNDGDDDWRWSYR